MKILIADAQPLLRAGVLRRLEQEHDFELVGLTRSGSAVPPIVDGLRPHVVLLDSNIPDANWLTCVEWLRASESSPTVVVMSTETDPTLAEEAFKSGASGFVLKSLAADDLASAIRQAVQGTAFHASGLPGLSEELTALAAFRTPERATHRWNEPSLHRVAERCRSWTRRRV
jgi:DNA-binding NarL/FixJ family response regulator